MTFEYFYLKSFKDQTEACTSFKMVNLCMLYWFVYVNYMTVGKHVIYTVEKSASLGAINPCHQHIKSYQVRFLFFFLFIFFILH